ncbi:MAG TPA: hypothetical protein VFF65_00695, partial [Phycisphaerales bacterium]|nr:hypothetical protein [Phycisphaerales bacterium]
SGELDGGGLWRFRAAAPLTGVTLPSAPPRLMAAQSAKLDGLSIGITTLQVAVNNTIADRATIGLGDSATVPDCGYGIPSIVARRVEVSGDPEMPVKATLDLVSRVAEGEEMPLDIEVGQLTGPSAANGVICVYAPRLQLTGELPMQQRNGLVACNLTGKCIGSGSDELYVAHCFD